MAQTYRPLMISEEWLEALRTIAMLRTVKSGRKVSMREVAETAFVSTYGTLEQIIVQREAIQTPEGVGSRWRQLAANGNEPALLAALVAAAIVRSDNTLIEEIPEDIKIKNDLGHPILPLRSLAYYLRTTKAKINTLQDLTIAYQFAR